MNNRVIVAALLLVCASPPALAGRKVELDTIQRQDFSAVIATKDQTPRFTFHAPKGLNPSHFLGGAVGIFMHAKAAERGSAILAEYRIEDPAAAIARSLAENLGQRLELEVGYQDSGLASSLSAMHSTLRNPKTLAGEYGSGKLVVNAGTVMWTMQGAGKAHYRIIYAVKATIVDTNEPAVLASAECSFPLKKRDQSRLAATMFDDDAASIKAEFQEIVEFCTDRLASEMF